MTKQTPHTVINCPKPALDLTNILFVGMDKLWDRPPQQHTYVLEYINSESPPLCSNRSVVDDDVRVFTSRTCLRINDGS